MVLSGCEATPGFGLDSGPGLRAPMLQGLLTAGAGALGPLGCFADGPAGGAGASAAGAGASAVALAASLAAALPLPPL